MILSAHQPIFLPWPGFFYKALRSDCMVVLDDVQFPRGRSWLTRNRLKNDNGELWLTVPVRRKGRGIERIREVEIYDERGWRRKHLRSLEQNYVHAPYFEDYFGTIEALYGEGHERLVDLNRAVIRFLWDALALETKLVVQSELGVTGRGTDLLVALCRQVRADRYAVFPAAEKHIDVPLLKENGIEPVHLGFRPPVYPQLWGDFIYNLSTVDLLFNCGPKSASIICEG